MIPSGYWYVFGCAVSFGLITTLAKLSYGLGASAETVVLFRIMTGSLLMGIWAFFSRSKKKAQTPSVHSDVSSKQQLHRQILLIILTGISIVIMSLGYLGSVQFIPVSLSVLLFFTFPFWVILINFLVDKVIPHRLKIVGFVMAFIGLGITLGTSTEGMDIRGILLVSAGALGSAGMIVGGDKAMKYMPMKELVFWANSFGVILVAVIIYVKDAFRLPQNGIGWLVVIGICVLFFLGQLCLYAATQRIGSAQTSVLLNLEPLVSIGAAILLLNENLKWTQAVGVFVVLVALLLASDVSKIIRRNTES